MHTLNRGIFRGMKVKKEGIIILVCANMDCSEKFPLLVAGSLKHPNYFSETKSLPYIATITIKLYIHSWLVRFLEFMINLNKLHSRIQRHSVPSTPKGNLHTVQDTFLSANITTVLQPMNQSNIRAQKQNLQSYCITTLTIIMTVMTIMLRYIVKSSRKIKRQYHFWRISPTNDDFSLCKGKTWITFAFSWIETQMKKGITPMLMTTYFHPNHKATN